MNELSIDTIIGIDAGANGGIAVYKKGGNAMAVKMPKDTKDLRTFLEYWKEISTPLVFIEKLTVRPDDVSVEGGETNMGKIFRIQKMMANYEAIKATLEIMEIPYVQVHPMKWQNGLKLRIKGEEKKARKNRYKDVAGKYYPNIKITLWNADALLIMHFGRFAITNMIDWVKQQLPTAEYGRLFK